MFKLKRLGFILALTFYGRLALAYPTVDSVVAGGVTFGDDGSTFTINQSTHNAIVNFSNFDTYPGQSVHINQPTFDSNMLVRVIGDYSTSFQGSLLANGRVFIMNEVGIQFSNTSYVNVGSLVVSSLYIDDNDFLNANGNYHFYNRSQNPSDVYLDGNINATEKIVTLASQHNFVMGGTVNAAEAMAMIVGDDVTFDITGTGLISVNVSKASILGDVAVHDGAVINAGQLAHFEVNATDYAIQLDGIVNANQIVIKGNGRSLVFDPSVNRYDNSYVATLPPSDTGGGQTGGTSDPTDNTGGSSGGGNSTPDPTDTTVGAGGSGGTTPDPTDTNTGSTGNTNTDPVDSSGGSSNGSGSGTSTDPTAPTDNTGGAGGTTPDPVDTTGGDNGGVSNTPDPIDNSGGSSDGGNATPDPVDTSGGSSGGTNTDPSNTSGGSNGGGNTTPDPVDTTSGTGSSGGTNPDPVDTSGGTGSSNPNTDTSDTSSGSSGDGNTTPDPVDGSSGQNPSQGGIDTSTPGSGSTPTDTGTGSGGTSTGGQSSSDTSGQTGSQPGGSQNAGTGSGNTGNGQPISVSSGPVDTTTRIIETNESLSAPLGNISAEIHATTAGSPAPAKLNGELRLGQSSSSDGFNLETSALICKLESIDGTCMKAIIEIKPLNHDNPLTYSN